MPGTTIPTGPTGPEKPTEVDLIVKGELEKAGNKWEK